MLLPRLLFITSAIIGASAEDAALLGGAHLAMGDYDGDDLSDLTLYEEPTHTFYTILSSTGQRQSAYIVPISLYTTYPYTPVFPPTIIPVSGDFDNDGKADYAVFLKDPTNPSYDAHMWVKYSGNPNGDVQDVAVFQPVSQQLINHNGKLDYVYVYLTTLVPICADFDGDGRTDIASYDPVTSTLYLKNPGRTFDQPLVIQFGQGGNSTPFIGDFNGDGKADFGVFERSTSTFAVLLNVIDTANSSGRGEDYTRVERAYAMTYGDPAWDSLPYVGAFDTPGISDIGVFNRTTSTFYYAPSVGGPTVARQFGPGRSPSLTPQPLWGNFAGDARADVGVFWTSPSSASVFAVQPTGGTPAPYAVTPFGQSLLHGQLPVSGPPRSPRVPPAVPVSR